MVNDFLAYLRLNRNASRNTIAAYGRDLAQFRAHISGNIEAVRARDIRIWIAGLNAAGNKPSSIARKLAAVKAFYRWLVLQEVIAVNPADAVECPKIPHTVKIPPSVEMTDRIIGQAKMARDRAILELFYSSGIRESELTALEVQDVDLEAGLVLVKSGKGAKGRRVPIGEAAIKAVREYLAERPHVGYTPLFLNPQNKALSRMGIWKIVNACSMAAGQHISPHDLRRACGTGMLEGGADIREVQEQLGHKNINTTQRYTYVTPTRLQNVHRKAHPRG